LMAGIARGGAGGTTPPGTRGLARGETGGGGGTRPLTAATGFAGRLIMAASLP
jgi:hypothetical protein